MSMSDLMVLRGRVGTNLTLHRPEDGGGRSFVRFRMVIPRARRNDSGKWEDGEPKWHTIRAWGPLAENMASSLRKGQPLVVIGRPAAHAWVGQDGEIRTELAINAFTAGHDMGFGITNYRRLAPVRPGEAEGPDIRIIPSQNTQPRSDEEAGNDDELETEVAHQADPEITQEGDALAVRELEEDESTEISDAA